MKQGIGIYIHVPFCTGKCPYCDFYSAGGTQQEMDDYTAALCREMKDKSRSYGRAAASVYFGGGTPSLLGYKRIKVLLDSVRDNFGIFEDAEITCELNPGTVDEEFFRGIAEAGVKRVSIGLQSANADELKLLGRKHSLGDVKNAVEFSKKAGIDNISLDLMIGLPGGTNEKIGKSAEFCASLGVKHISAYILKVEEGTPFYRIGVTVPEDDEVSAEYLYTVEKLKSLGFEQYEISNFSLPGYEGRHNLIYWHDEEYLGFGPSAHSFAEGKRFYYPRSTADYIRGNEPVQDGEGGDFEEYIMLGLRLREGISRAEAERRFGEGCFDELLNKTKRIPPPLIKATGENICLTTEGFLLSNSVISELFI